VSAALIQQGDCCNQCPDSSSSGSSVPGPQGPAGNDGTDGTDGVNAFTLTAASFTQPAVDANTASILVGDSTWMTVGQVVFVQTGGYYEVISRADATHVVLMNLGYDGNAAPAATINSGAQVSPGGLVGPEGPAGDSDTLNDLSPTTTKGDVMVDNGANAPAASVVRFAVGTNGTRLMADSTQAAGMRYAKVDLADTTQVTGATAIANGGTGNTTRAAAFDALAPASPVIGDVMIYNGTNWIRLAKGTNGQVLSMAPSTLPAWTDRGQVLQEVIASTASTSRNTTTIPYDDTIPQNTEGTELFSQAFTPKDTVSSYIEVEAEINGVAITVDTIIAALFKDSGADAVSAAAVYSDTNNKQKQVRLFYRFTQSGGTLFTMKLRLGTSGGVALCVNGVDDGGGGVTRRFGGVQLSWMRIRELNKP